MADLWARLTDAPEDIALVAVALLMAGFAMYALIGVLTLRGSLAGRPGHKLATILTVLVGAIAVCQGLTVAQAFLIAYDRTATIEARVVILIIQQGSEVAAVIWSLRQIGRITVDDAEMTKSEPAVQEHREG